MSHAQSAAVAATPAAAASPYLYRIDNDAILRVDAADDRALKRLFASVSQRLGPNVRVACWPYRASGQWTVALDLCGDFGSMELTVLTGPAPSLPGVRDCRWPLYVNDWTVIDAVDAYYLIAGLMAALDIKLESEDWPFLGLPRVIR